MAPGWYPDPVQPGHQRQWDGHQWVGPSLPLAGAKKGGFPKWLIPVIACLALGIVAVVIGAATSSSDDEDADPVRSEESSTTDEPATTDEPSTTEETTTTEEPTTTEAETTTTAAPTTAAPTTAAPTTPPGVGTVGNYTFADVQVLADSIDDFEVRARVTNNGPTVSASWTATIFAGGSVVATASGSQSDFQQGSTVTVTFITTDDYRDWDDVEFQVDYEF